jgi:hypothetical protein
VVKVLKELRFAGGARFKRIKLNRCVIVGATKYMSMVWWGIDYK